MRTMLLTTAASVVAFMSETCETVMAKIGGKGEYVRVNKSDVEANPKGYTVSDAKTDEADKEPAPDRVGVSTNVADGVIVPPAPSAPQIAPAAGQEAPPPAAPVAPTIPSPNQMLVMKEGNGARAKYFVVSATGAHVEGVEGIDAGGYKTEAEAWEAVKAQPH